MVLSQEDFYRYPKPSHFALMKTMLKLMQPEKVLNLLQTVPFFSKLPHPKLHLLSELFTLELFERGEVMCREGESGDSLYLLLEGRLQVVAEGEWVDLVVLRAHARGH